MVQNKLPQNNKLAEEMCGWGPQCPICAQSTPNLKAEDSEKEDWNSDRQETRRKTSWREITISQAHSTPHPMTFQIDYHITTRQRKIEKKD